MGKLDSIDKIVFVAEHRDPNKSTFDHLAEEVMELHLSMRGKHADTPAMEWLEIATLAIIAFDNMPAAERSEAFDDWIKRHASEQ